MVQRVRTTVPATLTGNLTASKSMGMVGLVAGLEESACISHADWLSWLAL
jgi:hypothetical protein